MSEYFTPDPGNENISVSSQLPEVKPPENVAAGIIGAFLFALAGGILWFILYQVGFIAGISGAVAVLCALKGYSLFAKGESTKGVVISVIASIIVIVIAWYSCIVYDVYVAYSEWFAIGELDFEPTLIDAIADARFYLLEEEIGTYYLKDLGIGVLLCVVACVGIVRNQISKNRSNKN